MTDTQNQNRQARLRDDLVDAAAAFGAGVVRLGIAAAWPLYLLPPKSRQDVIEVASNFAGAVGRLHLSLARGAIRGIEVVANELNRVIDEQLGPEEPKTRPVKKVQVETN